MLKYIRVFESFHRETETGEVDDLYAAHLIEPMDYLMYYKINSLFTFTNTVRIFVNDDNFQLYNGRTSMHFWRPGGGEWNDYNEALSRAQEVSKQLGIKFLDWPNNGVFIVEDMRLVEYRLEDKTQKIKGAIAEITKVQSSSPSRQNFYNSQLFPGWDKLSHPSK